MKNLDLDRVDQCVRAPDRTRAVLMDTDSLRLEVHAKIGRLSTARASREREVANGRGGRVHGDAPIGRDPIAEIDRELGRAREQYARLAAEVVELTETWQARKRLADRVRAYVQRHAPGIFDVDLTGSSFSERGL